MWVDAQLPPALARWLSAQPGVEGSHVQAEGLLGAIDRVIFEAARRVGAVVLTKDVDFVQLLERYGHRLVSCGSRAGTSRTGISPSHGDGVGALC